MTWDMNYANMANVFSGHMHHHDTQLWVDVGLFIQKILAGENTEIVERRKLSQQLAES